MGYYEECVECGRIFPVDEGVEAGFVTVYGDGGEVVGVDVTYACSAECLGEQR